jgi:hypothetical protein
MATMKWTRVFFVLMVISLPAYSLNLSFLIGTAAQHFNKQDRQMFDATLSSALDKAPNGKTVEWKNTATQNGGYFLPLSTVTKNGLTCRNVRIVNFSVSERLPDKYTFLFCKGKKGWVVSG